MTARENFGRRKHDFDIPQCVVELIRHCPAEQLTPVMFAAIINTLVIKAAEFDQQGWWGMDSVETNLAEAALHLVDVRGPGHEKRDAEDEQHQRELRQWAFERSL